jgi:5-methylcytosine-specific restriction endonuclease McrA
MTRTTFNDGEWTVARFNSFVKSALRSASQRWPVKYKVLSEAFVGQKTNEKSGRLAKHFKCNSCKEDFPAKDVQVDHIKPIIDPVVGFSSWDDVVYNMFCERDNLQVLCKTCHNVKTKQEKEERKNAKRI